MELTDLFNYVSVESILLLIVWLGSLYFVVTKAYAIMRWRKVPCSKNIRQTFAHELLTLTILSWFIGSFFLQEIKIEPASLKLYLSGITIGVIILSGIIGTFSAGRFRKKILNY